MSTKASKTEVRTNNPNVGIVHQELHSDTFYLQPEQIERIHAVRPDLVDVIVNQTIDESKHRRNIVNKKSLFVFIDRLIGKLFAFILGLSGILGAIYAGVNGQIILGGAIATGSLTVLAVAFLAGKQITYI
jgi:hypothetical protein